MSIFAFAWAACACLAHPASPLVRVGLPWIERSNAYARSLIDIDKKYEPEAGSSNGFAECDEQISEPSVANDLAKRSELEHALAQLVSAQKSETDSYVATDLSILVKYAQHELRIQKYQSQNQVPLLNAEGYVYNGIKSLLDDQTAPERRKAVIVRLRKYAGLVGGYRPITEVMIRRLKSQMAKVGVAYPVRQRIEFNLSHNYILIGEIGDLLRKYDPPGWQPAYACLKSQFAEFDDWTRSNLLPNANANCHLAPEQYALELETYGIDISPMKLSEMAHRAFVETQEEMQTISSKIAAQRGLKSSDYRYVIAVLKKDQVAGDSIIPLYRSRLLEIEQIIRDHRLVTLPDRATIIRRATAAETAEFPGPYMVAPPFMNNTGQRGVFLLPLSRPLALGQLSANEYDDYTYDAASWTLISHEARPGHDLQFDSMVENGMSYARAIYAFNSTNVEGWGLYSEAMVEPYMPLEGQLVSLDFRLLRIARAFLDPELQAGKIQPSEALQILRKDVGASQALAEEEVARYTLTYPGQADSYFYGYLQLMALRRDAELTLGVAFDQLRFNDFILAQGLLPPDQIRKSVMEEFVPREMAIIH